MKRILCVILMAFAMCVAISAQGNGQRQRPRMDRSEMIKRRTEQMVKQYGLDETQAKALQALNESQMPQMGGQFRGGQRQEMSDSLRQKMAKEREEQTAKYNEELQKIMTAEQFKAYTEDMKNRRRPQGMQRGGFNR